MKQMIITGHVISLHSGIVALTAEQAGPRMHALTDLGEGLYQIDKPIQFKRGEYIGFDGDINKELAELIESEETEGKASKKVKK